MQDSLEDYIKLSKNARTEDSIKIRLATNIFYVIVN